MANSSYQIGRPPGPDLQGSNHPSLSDFLGDHPAGAVASSDLVSRGPRSLGGDDGGAHRSEAQIAPHGVALPAFLDTCIRVDALQQKSRWLGDHPGSVESGRRMLERLQRVWESYRSQGYEVRFVTFTMDRNCFDSADAAWAAHFDQSKRWWGEWLRAFDAICPGVHVWMAAEPHGDGWPHFHALVFFKGHLDYRSMNAGWRAHLGGRGYVRAEVPDGDASVKYVAKYLTKGWHFVPDWFMEKSSCLHITRSTHGFWKPLGEVQSPRRGTGKPRTPPGSVRDVREAPKAHLSCLLRLITDQGEECFHRVKMDICTLVDAMGERGWLGGQMVNDRRGATGRAEFVPGSPSRRILDYSVNCGSSG